MLENIEIDINHKLDFIQFIQTHDYIAKQITNNVYQISRDEDLDVFIRVDEKSIYFQLELGSLKALGVEDKYYELLDLNTEILPVSVGIDSTDPEDKKLVIIESREFDNLDDNELLSVFDALQLAADKVENLISSQ